MEHANDFAKGTKVRAQVQEYGPHLVTGQQVAHDRRRGTKVTQLEQLPPARASSAEARHTRRASDNSVDEHEKQAESRVRSVRGVEREREKERERERTTEREGESARQREREREREGERGREREREGEREGEGRGGGAEREARTTWARS